MQCKIGGMLKCREVGLQPDLSARRQPASSISHASVTQEEPRRSNGFQARTLVIFSAFAVLQELRIPLPAGRHIDAGRLAELAPGEAFLS